MARLSKGIEVRGAEKVQRALGRMERGGRGALSRALYQEGERIMKHSRPLVPIEEGDLLASGFIDQPVERFSGVGVEIGYSAEYALKQHEDLRLKHDPGRQGKYLEQPALEAIPGMARRIAHRIEAAIEKESV